MGHWHLIAPDWAPLDAIWRSPLPFVLWPVCEKPLLAHWLDEAVRSGAGSVSIEAVDRPHLIRRWLDQRDLWSRAIEVHSRPSEMPAASTFVMRGLPGGMSSPTPETPKDLMVHWFGLQIEALGKRASGMVHLDVETEPGVWVGPGAKVAHGTRFSPPCWVGSHAKIGPGCRLGPRAFVGAGAFLDEDAEVADAVVCGDTYVGSHTTLRRMVAEGGLLMDLDKGIGVEVADDFVLSSLGATVRRPSLFERLAAALAAPVLEIASRIADRGQPPSVKTALLGRSKRLVLKTGSRGPLCLRRAGWLRHVAAGSLRLVGVLPRSEEEWGLLPPDSRSALEQAPAGVFALSDLYHCHSPEEPDEWMHAVFQAGAAGGAGQKLASGALLKIALTTPIGS